MGEHLVLVCLGLVLLKSGSLRSCFSPGQMETPVTLDGDRPAFFIVLIGKFNK